MATVNTLESKNNQHNTPLGQVTGSSKVTCKKGSLILASQHWGTKKGQPCMEVLVICE